MGWNTNLWILCLDHIRHFTSSCRQLSGGYNHSPVNYVEECQKAQSQKPKPQEDVNLLVDHIQWQNTHGVMPLNLSRYAVFEESTLGHTREDKDHRVNPILLIRLHECDNVDPECEEGTIEEFVHQEHLT